MFAQAVAPAVIWPQAPAMVTIARLDSSADADALALTFAQQVGAREEAGVAGADRRRLLLRRRGGWMR